MIASRPEVEPVLLAGGTDVTVDAHRTVLPDTAVLVRGGRIAAIGPSNELCRDHRDVEVVDVSGQVVIPGFVNLHVHSALTITRGLGDDLGGAPVYRRDIPQGVLLSESDVEAMSALGSMQALTLGSTTIVENYIHSPVTAAVLARLGIRAVISERVHDADLFSVREHEYRYDSGLGTELLAANVELIDTWHGWSDGRITCQVGPHGPDTCSTDLLQRCRQTASDKGVGLFIHLAQNEGEIRQVQARTGTTSVRHLSDIEFLGSDLVAGHCAFIDDKDIDVLLASATQVAQLPVVNAKSGWIAPAERLRQHGANVGLGTDHMTADMIEAMRIALCVNRIAEGGPGSIRAMDVLAMATINGAKAIGQQAEIGSLEVGKRADLVVVDMRASHLAPVLDPVASLVYSGQGADISRVMVDGETLVEHGTVTSVDAVAITARAQETAERLWFDVAGWRPGDGPLKPR